MKEDLIEEQENPSPDKPHKVKKGKQPKGECHRPTSAVCTKSLVS